MRTTSYIIQLAGTDRWNEIKLNGMFTIQRAWLFTTSITTESYLRNVKYSQMRAHSYERSRRANWQLALFPPFYETPLIHRHREHASDSRQNTHLFTHAHQKHVTASMRTHMENTNTAKHIHNLVTRPPTPPTTPPSIRLIQTQMQRR